MTGPTLGKRGSIQRGARSLGSGGLRRWFSCKYLDICKKTALHPIPIPKRRASLCGYTGQADPWCQCVDRHGAGLKHVNRARLHR